MSASPSARPVACAYAWTKLTLSSAVAAGLLAHLRARLDTDHLVRPVGPDPRRKARPAPEIDDEPGPVNLRFEAQDVDENVGRCGPIRVETRRKTAAFVPRRAQEPLAPVVHQIARKLRHARA